MLATLLCWGLLSPARSVLRQMKRMTRRHPGLPLYHKSKPRLVLGGLDRELETIMTTVEQEFSVSTAKKTVNSLLLYRLSGTGKTFLAESLPGRIGVSFVRVEILELLSKNPMEILKKKIAKARSLSPCVLFIDKINSAEDSHYTDGQAA